MVHFCTYSGLYNSLIDFSQHATGRIYRVGAVGDVSTKEQYRKHRLASKLLIVRKKRTKRTKRFNDNAAMNMLELVGHNYHLLL